MRWVLLSLWLSGCVAKTPTLLSSNWERICYSAPYADPVPRQIAQWLRQEGVGEHRGWRLTAAWLNANCETVPGRHRR